MAIIGLIQLKGGAGRSTIATLLAGELSKHGKTALVDCDMPQGTSASWAVLRQDPTLTIKAATNHRELATHIEQLAQSNEYVILDGPPRIAEMLRVILILSDLVLIPVGASAADVWATSDLLPIIEEAKQAKPSIETRIVWNRYRSYTRSAKEISTEAKEELPIPELETKLGLRVAYQDALALGQTPTETGDTKAKGETLSLVTEIQKILESIQ